MADGTRRMVGAVPGALTQVAQGHPDAGVQVPVLVSVTIGAGRSLVAGVSKTSPFVGRTRCSGNGFLLVGVWEVSPPRHLTHRTQVIVLVSERVSPR